MPVPTTTSLALALGTRPVGSKAASVISSPRIWAIGDSITFGTGGTTGHSWRQPVAEMLADAGVSVTIVGSVGSDAPDWPLHYALSGHGAADLLSNLQATPSILSNADPDIITMCTAGSGDLNQGDTPAQTVEAVRLLMEEFRAYTNGRSSIPRVVVSKMIGRNDGQQDDVVSFNSLVGAMWDGQEALGQDLYRVDPSNIGSPISALLSDTLHPNQSGYNFMADYIFPVLMNAIGLDAEWGRF